jgi:hypothetical protein
MRTTSWIESAVKQHLLEANGGFDLGRCEAKQAEKAGALVGKGLTRAEKHDFLVEGVTIV